VNVGRAQSLGAAAINSAVNQSPEPAWHRLTVIGVVLTALGVLGVILGLVSHEDERVWSAYLVGFLFFLGLAQGGVILSCSYYLVQGRWMRAATHMRVAEAGWPFLFLAVLLFAGVFVGRYHLFPWIAYPIAKNAAWLNVPFMFSRDIAVIAIMALLSGWYVRLSRRSDAVRWASEPTTIEMPPAGLRRLAPVACILYIYVYSLLAADLIMSLSPLWHSTLFGWWWFEMCFFSAICGSALVAAIFASILPNGNAFAHGSVRHDYGKLVFAFSIFWIYLSFAQYLVIWFGDLPSETFFLVIRFWHQPWEAFSWLGPILVWVLPFAVLMGVRPKKSKATLGVVSALVLIGIWLTDYDMVVPSLSSTKLPLGWVELLVTTGFAGLFLLCAVPGLASAARAATADSDFREGA